VVLATLSVAWSITPSFTETRLGAIATFALVALAFTLHGWHARRFQNVVRMALSILLLGSLIFGIYAPNLALEVGDSVSLKGAWHGLFTQKNPFGEAASIGLLLWVHAWLAKEVRFVHFLVGGGVAAACVILSNSSTGISAGLFGTIFLLLTMRSSSWNRRYTRSLIFVFVVAIALYILAALDIIPGLSSVLNSFNSLSGRDSTFSGRTVIWQLMQEQIKQHPALGVGYGAFWTGRDPSTPSYIFVLKTYGYPNEAHDGYLDIANDLGLVGLAIFLGYFVVFLRQSVALLKTEYSQAILFLTLLFHQLLTNLTESTWLFSSNMCFVVMTMAMFSLARTQIEQRLQSTIPQRPGRILRSAGLRPRLARAAPPQRA
jgi:exopolysaccharide production protein ExoQ